MAYVPGRPQRGRTVEHWAPGYQAWTVYAVMALLAGLLVGAAGLASAVRRGASEASGEEFLRPGPQDALGERLLRTDRRLMLLPWAGYAVVTVVVGAVGTSVPGNDPRIIAAVCAGFVAVLAAVGALMWWLTGSEGIWATPEHLVVRRMRTVRRWRWDELQALSFSSGGSPGELRAKADGERFAEPGPILWGTLLRPTAGPGAKWHAYRRLRQLADEHGVPFDLEDELPYTKHGKVQYG